MENWRGINWREELGAGWGGEGAGGGGGGGIWGALFCMKWRSLDFCYCDHFCVESGEQPGFGYMCTKRGWSVGGGCSPVPQNRDRNPKFKGGGRDSWLLMNNQ